VTAPVLRARRACLYLRVSGAAKSRHAEVIAFEQDPAVQERPLRDLVTHRGWTLYRIYSDRLSGVKEARPLNALMADARRGAFDVVVVWRFDRFARSCQTAWARAGGIPLPGNRLHFASGGVGHPQSYGPRDVAEDFNLGGRGYKSLVKESGMSIRGR
jgi:hypothetical protein